MADLPATQNKTSTSLTPVQAKIAESLGDGVNYRKIAKVLAKGDPKKAKMWRSRIRYWASNVPAFQLAVADAAKGELIMGVPQSSRALIKRASRGRVDAIKLAYEASGFYNPRIQHEHSGDIKVTIDIPRPERVDERPGNSSAAGPGPEVVDAEVVED